MAYTPTNPGAMPGVTPLASAPAPPSTAPVGGTPPPGQGTTFAPILTLARALANYAQQPQRTTILENQASSDASAREQAAAIQGYMTALAHTLQGIAPAVQTGYTQAAGLDALLGKGFGNQLAGQGPADQAATQSLANISGAPQGQVDAVNAVTPNAGLGNALGWLNGGLPAQGLNQAGAAFGAAARMLPATAAGQGLEQIQNVQGRQTLADQGFQQKLGDLAAQYPGLLLKTATGLQQHQDTVNEANARIAQQAATEKATEAYRTSNARALAAYRDDQVKIGAQRAADTAAYQQGELTARQYANKISASRAANSAATARYNAATSRMTANYRETHPTEHFTTVSDARGTYVVNEDTGAKTKVAGPKATAAANANGAKTIGSASTGYAWQYPNGKIKPFPGRWGKPSSSTSGGSGGVTATRARTLKLSGTAETVAQHAYTGFKDTKGTWHPKIGYAAAYEEMLKEGIPKRMALAALNRAYPPGARETQLNPDATGPPAP